jgi:hypothetical protein
MKIAAKPPPKPLRRPRKAKDPALAFGLSMQTQFELSGFGAVLKMRDALLQRQSFIVSDSLSGGANLHHRRSRRENSV